MYYTIFDTSILNKVVDKPIQKGTYLEIDDPLKLYNRLTLKYLETNEVIFISKHLYFNQFAFKHKYNVGDTIIMPDKSEHKIKNLSNIRNILAVLSRAAYSIFDKFNVIYESEHGVCILENTNGYEFLTDLVTISHNVRCYR